MLTSLSKPAFHAFSIQHCMPCMSGISPSRLNRTDLYSSNFTSVWQSICMFRYPQLQLKPWKPDWVMCGQGEQRLYEEGLSRLIAMWVSSIQPSVTARLSPWSFASFDVLLLSVGFDFVGFNELAQISQYFKSAWFRNVQFSQVIIDFAYFERFTLLKAWL